MLARPINTLFILASVDGKISTGDNDVMDAGEDLQAIRGVKEGFGQYFDIEKTTDSWSLNTGRVMAKAGVNRAKRAPNKVHTSYIIIDNKPHLALSGLRFIANTCDKLILVTENKEHPAFHTKINNMEVIRYSSKKGFTKLFEQLKKEQDVKFITVQSGGTLNSALIREGLIDYVSLIIAPALIGGKDTSTIMDGESLHVKSELKKIRALKLLENKILDNSYLHLIYEVLNT